MNLGQGLVDGAFQRYFHCFFEFEATAFVPFKHAPDIFECWAKILQQRDGPLPAPGKVRAEDEMAEVALGLAVTDGFNTSSLE